MLIEFGVVTTRPISYYTHTNVHSYIMIHNVHIFHNPITPIQFFFVVLLDYNKHIGSVNHFTFQRKHIAIKAFSNILPRSNIVYHQPSESRHDTIRIPLRRKVI